MMQPIKSTVLSRIYGHGRGWVFTPKAFADIASPTTIGPTLNRLVEEGRIRKLARGLYDYPKTHPQLGSLIPPVESVAKAIAGRDHIRLLPSGAYAANLLGLSEQVPAKVVFLTDGRARRIVVGKMIIELRKTSPRHMALAGKESGIVVQALRHLTKAHVTNSTIQKLRRVLSAKAKKELASNFAIAPAWMRPILKEISGVR